jgi:hypothetical protein
MTWLRHRWVTAVFFAVAAALLLLFSWHPGLGSISDDSVSYLNIARCFLDPSDPMIREWVGYQVHFPPLLPLLLVITGGARNLLAANLLVGGLAVLALAAYYGYAAQVLANRRQGLAIAAAFLLLPTAWVSVRGIVSEPLYLLLTLGFLWFCAVRMREPAPRWRDALIAGLLLGAAWLARSAAAALVAAYAVYVTLRLVHSRGRGWRSLVVPPLVLVVMAAAWIALKPPSAVDGYDLVLRQVGHMLTADPLGYAGKSITYLTQSWIASFTLNSNVGFAAKLSVCGVGLIGVAGAIVRAVRNRLDGWYVLAYLAMLFLWLFPESQMRRLLYPIAPLLLLQAVWLLRAGIARLSDLRMQRLFWAVAIALPAVAVLPATLLLAQRALLREPALPRVPYVMAGMRDLYVVLGTREARARAAGAIAMLAGFDAVRTATPADARIMWMRPDYVAVLAARRGLPWYYGERLDGLLQRALDEHADYLIASNTYKGDMRGEQTERFDDFAVLRSFADPVVVVPNAETGADEFALLRVDRARLAALIAQRTAGHIRQ